MIQTSFCQGTRPSHPSIEDHQRDNVQKFLCVFSGNALGALLTMLTSARQNEPHAVDIHYRIQNNMYYVEWISTPALDLVSMIALLPLFYWLIYQHWDVLSIGCFAGRLDEVDFMFLGVVTRSY